MSELCEQLWTCTRDQPEAPRQDRRIYAWPIHIGNAVSISDARAICDSHNDAMGWKDARIQQLEAALRDTREKAATALNCIENATYVTSTAAQWRMLDSATNLLKNIRDSITPAATTNARSKQMSEAIPSDLRAALKWIYADGRGREVYPTDLTNEDNPHFSVIERYALDSPTPEKPAQGQKEGKCVICKGDGELEGYGGGHRVECFACKGSGKQVANSSPNEGEKVDA